MTQNDFIEKVNNLGFTTVQKSTGLNSYEFHFIEENEIEELQELCKYIYDNGYKTFYFGEMVDSLIIDGYKYWIIDFWYNARIINRIKVEKDND